MKNDRFEFSADSEKNDNTAISISQIKRRKKDILTYCVCLLIAIVLWIYVMNVGITDYEQSITVPVSLAGEIPEEYSLYSDTDFSATIKLKGKKTDILSITPDQINAYIDLGAIESDGRQVLEVKVEELEGISAAIEAISPKNLSVTVCNRISKKVSVTADSSNIAKVSGYVYDVSVSEPYVEITGPDALIDRIDHASAVCNLSSAVTSTTEISNVTLVFYTEAGEVISEKDISYITSAMTNVSVTITVTPEEGSNNK